MLSIREWTGKPYKSPQRELSVQEEIGLQKLEMTHLGWFVDDADSDVKTHTIALNDGLLMNDFTEWFRGVKIGEPMAIIHFSNYRYL